MKSKERTHQERFKNIYFIQAQVCFKAHVQNNLINNCEVTVDDINRAEIVYGLSVPYLQGRMVQCKPEVHDKIEKIPLPPMIAQHHLNLAMYMDFFYVNENIFFTQSQTRLISLPLNTAHQGPYAQ